jgi:threonine synthase
MTTTGGANTHVIGVKGNFDDTQTGVKRLFSDPAFHEKMNDMGKLPSSANSINFGRLAPQVVYYFTAYTDLVASGALRMGSPMNVVVPTGNFGNILAAYYAMQMGLPIGRLICASNRNNVLSDFFHDGLYYTHRTFFKTLSPSMDILISSNLERLLYEITDRDGQLVKTWMNLLAECGSFSIGAQRQSEIEKIFWGGFADDTMTAEEIRRVYERKGYLLDPHTAVASHVLEQYREETNDRSTALLVATASPFKFAEDVLAALIGKAAAAELDAFACADRLQDLARIPMPRQVAELKDLPVRHQRVCEPSQMEAAVFAALSGVKP